MEPTNILPLLEQLDDDIDDLEEVLQPLLQNPLSVVTQKLPVLDKAKLHVLLTYTIESLIFSFLRLHGINAKEHPVFKELTRVKQYFQKIKALETPPEKRNMTLDKQAAGRIIKHGLTGNEKYDLERAEREAKEKAMAQLKAAQLARKSASAPRKRAADEMSSSDSGDEDNDEKMAEVDPEAETEVTTPATEQKSGKNNPKGKKRQKGEKGAKTDKIERKRRKLEKRKAKKAARLQKLGKAE